MKRFRLPNIILSLSLVAISLVASLFVNNYSTHASVTPGTIYTMAGGGNGDGFSALGNTIIDPRGVTAYRRTPSTPVDLYIADGKGRRVRKVDGTTGLISTIAGTGASG